ncbi:hypothetical protein DPEC_G00207040 [Dallia pectoralis]|uniref:Uncharacterized protein n=1 Tax=Dallia pectoralis TaxID=75939 RepID=A0ACC2G4Y0_DALPE|nr:hypothetical protein DPEC_G00207040 [Dallia pectoralis]
MTTSPTRGPAKICMSYSLRPVGPSHQFKPGDLVKPRQPDPVRHGDPVKPEHSVPVPVNICTNYAFMTTSPTPVPAKICTSYSWFPVSLLIVRPACSFLHCPAYLDRNTRTLCLGPVSTSMEKRDMHK